MNLSGKFLVIEGTDLAGKTTLINSLIDYLKINQPNLNVHITKEPTNNFFGKELRRIITSKIKTSTEQLIALFYADRVDHQQEINTYLHNRYLVITDRYYHSTLAYQEEHYNLIKKMHMCASIKQPDVLFILESHIDTLLQRLNSRGQNDLFEEKEKLLAVQTQYNRIIEDNFPYPIKKIDTSHTLDFSLKTVVEYLEILSL